MERENDELFEEDLEKVLGGIDYDKLKEMHEKDAKIYMAKPNSELNEEELEQVQAGEYNNYEEENAHRSR